MNSSISLLLPTRGRPHLVKRLFDSLLEHAHHPDHIEVVIYVDDDDIASHNLSCSGLKLLTIIGPRASMGVYNTACLRKASGDILVLANDDMIIRTPGWDSKIRELDASVPDRIYLAYGNDLFKKSGVCTFPILSRRLCEALGDPFPEKYYGAFIDYHILDIFKRLRRRGLDRIYYLEDVVFEHMHYRVGKADFDDTYRSRARFVDDYVFISMQPLRSVCAQRLISIIGGRHTNSTAAAPALQDRSLTLFDAVFRNIRVFLLDHELPYRWRLFLYVWFFGRYLASEGYLGWLERLLQIIRSRPTR